MSKGVVVGVVLVLLGLTAAVYGSQIMTQTFPVVPATVQVVTSNCTSPLTLLPVPNAVAIGSSGGVSFGCTGAPAFKVTTDGASTPTFNLPAPYTSIALLQSASAPATGCSTSTGPTVLTSGTAFTFTGSPTSWNYCVMYSNAGISGLPTFTISWSN